jgi:hypothetical protein
MQEELGKSIMDVYKTNLYKQIIENLRDRVYPVNLPTAISGTPSNEGFVALRDLVNAGRVIEIHDREKPTMYRLRPTGAFLKVVK